MALSSRSNVSRLSSHGSAFLHPADLQSSPVASNADAQRLLRLSSAVDGVVAKNIEDSKSMVASLKRSMSQPAGQVGAGGPPIPAGAGLSEEERNWVAPSTRNRPEQKMNGCYYWHPVHNRGTMQLSPGGIVNRRIDPLLDKPYTCKLWLAEPNRFERNAKMPEARPETPQKVRRYRSEAGWQDYEREREACYKVSTTTPHVRRTRWDNLWEGPPSAG